MHRVEEVMELYATRGAADYGHGRETISQVAHALQCAALAEAESAAPSMIAAALLHDIGHLLAKHRTDGVDDRHESIGWGYLTAHFGRQTAEPVRLHVAAKRYLCAVEPTYAALLSPASVHSLKIQGGQFTAMEVASFLSDPFAVDAVRLRRWDDLAKVRTAKTRAFPEYAELLRGLSR